MTPSRVVQPGVAQNRRVLLTTRLMVVAMTLSMLVLLGRVAQLQFMPEAPVVERMERTTASANLHARRGALLDSRGRALAVSRLGYRLFADPLLIDDPSRFALYLAHELDDDPARIDQLVDARFDSRYVVLNPLLDQRQVETVREMNLRAVGLEPRLVRQYPHGSIAGQVIGFVGAEHTGLDGAEHAVDAYLSGKSGRLKMLRDVQRRPLWVEREGFDPPEDGRDVRLSIDTVIQAIAENELAAVCEEYQAARGEIVVMDARNGQLLAVANWPPVKPQEFPYAEEYIRRNRAVTDAYEPGSIFKPFLHAVATERGLASPNQKLDTGPGVWVSPGGRRLRDAHPHGELTWDEVLIVSSNIGMAKVLGQLSRQEMFDAVRSFGFGVRPGTGLPGESPGLLAPVRNWTSYSLTSIPMGQEIGATPVQLAQGFSAFANDGMTVAPSILAEDAHVPIYQRVLDPKIAEHTRMVMRQVVAEGTGRRAESELYRIWGKTGTSQMARKDGRGYAPGKYSASFICGAPLLDPRIIVTVSIHEPEPSLGYYGGIVAAPAAKAVVEQTLGYLGVAPDAEELAPSQMAQSEDVRD